MPIEKPRSRLKLVLPALWVVLVLILLCDAKLWRPGELLTIKENIQIAEAQAWWQGRLDLPERKWDAALFQGKVYSPFPPMFTFMSAAIVPFFGGVPHGFVSFLIVLPATILAYALFLNQARSPWWAAIGAIGLLAGTSALPVMDKTLRSASPYFVNQTLALGGTLLFLIEYFGRGRVAVMGVALAVAAWSRQLTIVYALPFIWSAWRPEGESSRVRRCIWAGCIVVPILVVPLILNALKFGHPLDSGYLYIYNDRPDDALSRDARTYGLFSSHFVPRNAYHANVGLPDLHPIQVEGREQFYLRPNSWGTGIWWTTPLLLWVLFDLRRIWDDPRRRMLLLAALLANVALLFYHNTGYQQRGFNRFSLDYVPALLAFVAPTCFVGWRRWVSLAMVAWSVGYFAFLIRLPHLRIW